MRQSLSRYRARPPINPWNVIGWLLLIGLGVFVVVVTSVFLLVVFAAHGG